ncbi:MAG: AraC family transcriptional regulator [Verrucomicrobiota bacterium]
MALPETTGDLSGQLSDPEQIAAAFDLLPNAYFFAKDRSGRFLYANQALVEALGLPGKQALVGRTDYDFFDSGLADEYRAEDERVMRMRFPLKDQVWLVPSMSGDLNWYLSSKVPLMGPRDEVVGIVGVMRDFEQAGSTLSGYRGMTAAISHVKQNYGSRIEIPALAQLVNLSVSQFERRFKQLFQCTPSQYIGRVRLHAAIRMLNQTDLSIGEIALDCGFYDQSHFTKLFRREKGQTPTRYRRRDRERRAEGKGIQGLVPS